MVLIPAIIFCNMGNEVTAGSFFAEYLVTAPIDFLGVGLTSILFAVTASSKTLLSSDFTFYMWMVYLPTFLKHYLYAVAKLY
jgi:hypothetical protein